MQYIISDSNIVIEDKHYTGDIGAFKIHDDGKPYHTFRTQTVLADGNNILFRKCTFENIAGPGEKAGQAIALYIDGDNIICEDCVIKGNQDTLFIAPLPPKEYEIDGFLGPKQFTPRYERTAIFRNCIIEGSVDFIFGGATCYFEGCTFISNAPGYVFAPCTPEGVKEGFVARDCRFEPSEGVDAESCFIARPWREYGKVKLIDCYLGPHINPEGWDDWGKTEAHSTILFEEYNSYGPGADKWERPYYVKSDREVSF